MKKRGKANCKPPEKIKKLQYDNSKVNPKTDEIFSKAFERHKEAFDKLAKE